MSFRWTRMMNPAWTADLERIAAGLPESAMPAVGDWRGAAMLPGTWWTVQDESGAVVAAAMLDTVWGDGHVQVWVAPDARRSGAGSFAMDQLRGEAQSRGLAWLRGEVPEGPDRDRVVAWLDRCGFTPGCSVSEYHLQVRRQRAAA